MFFSIIVPVYNTEKYLVACLDSIQNQLFSDFEVVMIDDGSTDGCGKICDQYVKKDSRFKCLHLKNQGVSSARNKGIQVAQGQYICFVDSDDFVDDGFLTTYYRLVEKTVVDIAFAGIKKFPINSAIESPFLVDVKKKGIEFIEDNPIEACNIVFPFSFRYCFRRVFLESNHIQFNEKVRFGEDAIFNIKAIKCSNSMICTDRITYNYRVDNLASATKHFKPTMVADLSLNYLERKELAQFLKKNQFEYLNGLNRKFIFDFLISSIENYKRSKDGFNYIQGKELMNSIFVKEGVEFLLTKKLINRKLQFLYFSLLKRKNYLVYLFWKYGKIELIFD